MLPSLVTASAKHQIWLICNNCHLWHWCHFMSPVCNLLMQMDLTLNFLFPWLWMPEINRAKTQWNKQNVIRLVLIAGIKFKYPNWGRKLLHMNSTISYFSRGCSPSVKVTICLGNFLSTRFWAEHSLNAFPLGQEDSITMLQATQLKVCLKTQDLAWTHYISYDGHPS